MDWHKLFQFEWLIFELIVLGILVWQLISVNRDIRRAREKEEREQAASKRDHDDASFS